MTDTDLCRKVGDPWETKTISVIVTVTITSNNWGETSAACTVGNRFHKLSPGKLLNKPKKMQTNFKKALQGKNQNLDLL